jgi:hypothetical protein
MSAWQHHHGLDRWRRGCAVAVVAALSVASAQPARAAWARIYVLAPTPPTSLLSVEKHGETPRFEKEFSTSYDHIEPLITDVIKKKVNGSKEGTAGCSSACPDLQWQVTVKADFTFTDKGQPMVQAFGDPQQQYGLDITVHAQVKVKLDVDHKVWATGTNSVTWNRSGDVFINIDASGKLNLWPILQSEVAEPQLSDSDGHVFDLTDPQNFSYVHVGKFTGGYCSLSPGTCEDARKQMAAQLNKRLFVLLKAIEEQVGAVARSGTDAKIPQPINLKDQLLNTKLPVVNKSFQELSGAFGQTLDERAVTYPGNVTFVATLRFSGAAGSAKLTGKVRLPKERCTYLSGVHGVLVTKVAMGFEMMNTDLAAKVGSSCSSILPSSAIKVSGYLGANPKTIVPGWAPPALQTWTEVGDLKFVGNLIEKTAVTGSGSFKSTGYYECGFEITGLPSADIIELFTSSPLLEMLGDYGEPSKKLRYLEVAIPGQQPILLDSYWELVETTPQGLVLGGEGQCIPLQIVKVLQVLEEFPPVGCPACANLRRLIDECRHCGIRKIKEGLFEITIPLALIRNPKFKGLVDALKEDEQFPSLSAPDLLSQGLMQTR